MTGAGRGRGSDGMETTARRAEGSSGEEALVRSRRAFLILAPLFTLISIFGVNGYHYGVWDHAVVIPFVKASIHPGLYAGDYLMPAQQYYYTFLWKAIALVARATGLPLPWLFFACYCAALAATFFAFSQLAAVLFGRWEVGLLACALLVFSRVTLADTATVESIFLTRTAALPLVLFSLCAFFRGQYRRASVLLGVTALVHPLSASYAAIALAGGALVNFREIGLRRALACAAFFIAVASPLLVWKALRSPAEFRLLSADTEWMRLLALRSGHQIFPFSWALREFARAAIAVVVFAVLVAGAPRSIGRRTVAAVIAVLVLCALGVVCAEWVPLPAVFTLQPLRSFQLIVYFAMLYLASFLFGVFEGRRSMSASLVAALFSFALVYGSNGWKGAAPASCAFILVLAAFRSRAKRLSPRVVSCAFAGCVLVAGVLASPGRRAFAVDNGQDHRWLEVQRWARTSTAPDDAFIVPPRSEGFRVESERPVYADWKDGTLMNFDPAFGREWYRRMKRLGVPDRELLDEGFARLAEDDFRAIAREDLGGFRAVFLVSPRARGPLGFPVVHENPAYVVYEVAGR